MKKSVDLLMFDLDGTLANTGRDLADAVNYTREHFALPPLPDALVKSHVGRGPEYLLKHSLPEKFPDCFQEVMRVFLGRYEDHLVDTTVLYPNVEEILEFFRGKKKVVISNKLHYLTSAVLRGLGVEGRFDAILGGDSGPEKKPHPALLIQVLERFQVDANQTIFVGDSDVDIEAGKRAGVMTCGVTYGLGSKEDLIAASPDFLIDDLSELPRFFC
jgi:2-phosphoglycolate phosphatase